jgi:FCP1-like phosphatase family protein
MRRKRAENAGGSERGRSGELSRARLLFPGDHGGTVQQWCVEVGQSFEARDVLARCLCDSLRGDRKPLLDLVAPYDGTVLSLEYAAGARVPAPQGGGAEAAGAAQTVARISFCMHDIVLAGFGLCGVCGRKPSQLSGTASGTRFEQEAGGSSGGGGEGAASGGFGDAAGSAGAGAGAGAGPTGVDPDSISATAASMTVNLGGGNAIMVSRSEAEGERRRMLERLFRTRKLLLVLDIDHTMLHATDDVRAPAFAQGKQLGAELHSFKMPASEDYATPDKVHHVMLRPGLAHWLERLAAQYELYIYTAGTRTYAEAVAKIFDPQGRLFGSRIISRTDVPELGKVKRLERFFPIDNSMVLAVDDRSDVWTGDASNLITIRPYHFFHGMADLNNTSGPEFDAERERAREEREERAAAKDKTLEDHGLKRVGELLRWVHERFFGDPAVTLEAQLAGKGGDVKKLLKRLRARVVRELPLVVDPNGFQGDERDRRAVADLALACGAKTQNALKTDTKVLLTRDAASPIALQAVQNKVWVLHPNWLHACVHNWNKEPFAPFSLIALASSPTHAASTPAAAAAVAAAPGAGGAGAPAAKKPPQRFDEFGYPIEDGDDATAATPAPRHEARASKRPAEHDSPRAERVAEHDSPRAKRPAAEHHSPAADDSDSDDDEGASSFMAALRA